jgi:hypothetical protein
LKTETLPVATKSLVNTVDGFLWVSMSGCPASLSTALVDTRDGVVTVEMSLPEAIICSVLLALFLTDAVQWVMESSKYFRKEKYGFHDY